MGLQRFTIRMQKSGSAVKGRAYQLLNVELLKLARCAKGREEWARPSAG
jgi:hypothetical protein